MVSLLVFTLIERIVCVYLLMSVHHDDNDNDK
jgi:hypothetical protein